MSENRTILSIENLSIKFKVNNQVITAIGGLSLDVYEGENLVIVGESGSGKSVLVKSLIGLVDKNGWIEGGSILYEGRDLVNLNRDRDWLSIRGKEIAIVFQEPMSSLNPLKTIGKQIDEVIVQHRRLNSRMAKIESLKLLKDVGIDNVKMRYKQYPHEFSGGMRQRIVIAIALACKPRILICDEPTTALDVTIQAQILELIKEMGKAYNLTIIYITHDLGVVANIADRVAVIYGGDIVEIGKSEEVFYNAKHPYTWALLSSLPHFRKKGESLHTIKRNSGNKILGAKGDPFAARNPYALNIDFVKKADYYSVSSTHKVKSWLMDPRAPKVKTPRIVRNLSKSLKVDGND